MMSQQPPIHNSFTFEAAQFGPVFCRRLNDMRLRGELCDVELVSGTDADRVEISAHKNVLMASSPYFEGMFSNGFEEQKKQRVEIKGVTGASLSTIVGYMYTGNINNDQSSVRDLMHTASMMIIDDVKEACGKYLSSSVSDSTCVDLLSIGSRYNCQEMITAAIKHIKRNFKRLSSSGALRGVDREMVTLLLTADDLTGGEKAVYEFLIDWVRADPETRAEELPSLLSHVRMPLLGNMFIVEKVGLEPLITGDTRCSEIYINALKYYTAAATDLEAAGRYGSSCWGRTRNPFPFPLGDKQWTASGKLLAKRRWHAVASLADRIFSAGGNDNDNVNLSLCEMFNPFTGESSLAAELPSTRRNFGMCTMGDLIYLTGGVTDGNYQRGVLIYDSTRNEWLDGPALTHNRMEAVSCLDGVLYTAASDLPTTSAEMWDPRTVGWQSIASMCEARASCRLAAVNDGIFALCGTGSDMMEVYDRRADAWRPTDIPNLSRDRAGVTVCEGRLIVAGGFEPNTWNFIQSVKVLRNSVWQKVQCSGFGVRGSNGLVECNGALFTVGGYSGVRIVDNDISSISLAGF